MKKLMLILILLAVTINAQNWNSIVTTNINVSNVTYIENHADKDGIHIVTLDNNDDIKYYLIDTDGSTIRSTTISTNGDYPNIVGDETAIYVIYREGSNIRIKKTADAGVNWSQGKDQSIGSNPCSGIDATIDYRGIHVVWSIGDSYGQDLETNYKRFVDGSNSWVDYYNVTNYTGGYGTSPTVAVSPNRVHVGYNSHSVMPDYYYLFDEDEMSRTKYNNNWQTQQTIASNESGRGKIFAASSKLYDFYYDFVQGMGQFHSDLYFKNRNYGTTSWSTSTLLEGFSDVTVPLAVCETADGYIHTYTASDAIKERVIVNGSVNSTTDISNSGYIYALTVSSTYNDIFVNWCTGNSNYLKMRHYDASPKKPQNFSTTFTSTNPVLTWSANPEPDIQSYKIYKMVVGETGWANVATVSSTTTQWTDTDVTQPGKFDPVYEIDYKIKAVDQSNNLSPYSDVKKITGTTNVIWKQNLSGTEAEGIETYKLFTNYPNPFNPTTEITYQLPKAGFVNLVVYNGLGQLVSTLVNERKERGRYTVEFNAANLPSGMYIYQITAGKYRASGKMLLMK